MSQSPCPDSLESMSTYDLVADLPVTIERYELEGLVQNVSSDFERKTTIIHLHGAGEEGLGEDVVYDAVDHEIAQKAGPTLALAGDWTIRSFSEHLHDARALLRSAPARRGVAALPRLGLRVRGARPRAAPGGQSRCTRCSAASRAR